MISTGSPPTPPRTLAAHNKEPFRANDESWPRRLRRDNHVCHLRSIRRAPKREISAIHRAPAHFVDSRRPSPPCASIETIVITAKYATAGGRGGLGQSGGQHRRTSFHKLPHPEPDFAGGGGLRPEERRTRGRSSREGSSNRIPGGEQGHPCARKRR